MRTKAAVAVAAGQPLEVMEVNLEGPRADEVLVEINVTGLCHTVLPEIALAKVREDAPFDKIC